MSKLAIKGGPKIRTTYFPAQNNIGKEEKEAVSKVLDSGILSGYRGSWSQQFYGGDEVKALEREFAEKFKTSHAIACNSCTSALFIACRAVDLDRTCSVIVTPWSMTCSASMPLAFEAVPIFADIENEFFCMDVNSIKENLMSNTKAIIAVDLFGHPYDADKVTSLLDFRHMDNCYVIEDAAQAIGATYKGRYAGTLGDIGVFSFTQGKILFAGEGGMIITDNDHLAMKCRLIMNHADAVIHEMEDINKMIYGINHNLLGYNLRMTEIQAAIIRCQLKKLDDILAMRRKNVKKIDNMLGSIPAISPTITATDCQHAYYAQPFIWHREEAKGVHRNRFIEAVAAELMPEEGRLDKALLSCGYITPLYRFPIYEALKETRNITYKKLPVVERLWKETFFLSMYHGLPLEENDFNDIANAFYKVWEEMIDKK